MPPPSLREIEQLVSELWLNQDARRDYLRGDARLPREIAKELDPAGVELYASLLEFGQQDVMASIFPNSAKLLKSKWTDVVDDYFICCPANHYHLNLAASRFPGYLKEHQHSLLEKYPFLFELADYEWIEVEILEKNALVQKQPNLVLVEPADFLRYRPVLNPVLILRQYGFAITKIAHRLEEGKRLGALNKPAISRVAGYRDPESNRCVFLDLNEVAFEVLQALADAPHSYAELIKLAISRSPQLNTQQSVADFLSLNETLHSLNVFVGSTNADS